MNRRHYLSIIGSAGIASTAGCLGGGTYDVAVPTESVYFNTIDYITNITYVGRRTKIRVELHDNSPVKPTVVLLFIDGEQYSFHRIGTGSTVAKMPPAETPDPSEIKNAETIEFAVVNGGERVSDSLGGWVWDGGEILEKIQVTIEKVSNT